MKDFIITKNTYKKGEKEPDYRMSIKDGDQFTNIGACWLKEGKNGKFFSCKLQDVYVDHTKGTARKGFELVAEPLAEPTPKMPEAPTETDDTIPF